MDEENFGALFEPQEEAQAYVPPRPAQPQPSPAPPEVQVQKAAEWGEWLKNDRNKDQLALGLMQFGLTLATPQDPALGIGGHLAMAIGDAGEALGRAAASEEKAVDTALEREQRRASIERTEAQTQKLRNVQTSNEQAQRARERMDYLIGKGVDPKVAAAIVGNTWHESSLDPNAVGDNGASIGEFQFNRRGEQPAFVEWAKSQGRDPRDWTAQYDFVLARLQGPYKSVYDKMVAAPDHSQAALEFSRGYERPGIPHEGRRVSLAQQALQVYQKGSGGGKGWRDYAEREKLRRETQQQRQDRLDQRAAERESARERRERERQAAKDARSIFKAVQASQDRFNPQPLPAGYEQYQGMNELQIREQLLKGAEPQAPQAPAAPAPAEPQVAQPMAQPSAKPPVEQFISRYPQQWNQVRAMASSANPQERAKAAAFLEKLKLRVADPQTIDSILRQQ